MFESRPPAQYTLKGMCPNGPRRDLTSALSPSAVIPFNPRARLNTIRGVGGRAAWWEEGTMAAASAQNGHGADVTLKARFDRIIADASGQKLTAQELVLT